MTKKRTRRLVFVLLATAMMATGGAVYAWGYYPYGGTCPPSCA